MGCRTVIASSAAGGNQRRVEEYALPNVDGKPDAKGGGMLVRCGICGSIVQRTTRPPRPEWLQCVLYNVFLFAFQSLAHRHPPHVRSCDGRVAKPRAGVSPAAWRRHCPLSAAAHALTGRAAPCRLHRKEEFFIDKLIEDTFIINTFDGNHNRFRDIRRMSDIWEWQDKARRALARRIRRPMRPPAPAHSPPPSPPAPPHSTYLRGRPRCSDLSAYSNAPSAVTRSPQVLVAGIFTNADYGESWPDSSGMFGLGSDTSDNYHSHLLDASDTVPATPFSTADSVDFANSIYFGAGIRWHQVRAAPTGEKRCFHGHECYGDAYGTDDATNGASKQEYGHNGPHFVWWNQSDLGADSAGNLATSPLTRVHYSASGFPAFFIPFYSSQYLPHERGTFEQVTDFRLHRATPTNYVHPTYYCARASPNGLDLEQQCNPDPLRNDFLARRTMSEMLYGMQRDHWIDAQTRLIVITVPLRNNNVGIRFTVHFNFEIKASGSVIPSYRMETVIDNPSVVKRQLDYLYVSVAMCMFFALFEVRPAAHTFHAHPPSAAHSRRTPSIHAALSRPAMCMLTLGLRQDPGTHALAPGHKDRTQHRGEEQH